MTAPALTPQSARYEAAKRFSVELRRAMNKRKLRPFHVYKAIGGGYSSYQWALWMEGGALPRLDRTIRLAEFLDWPVLVDIVRKARTSACNRRGCTNTYITETGKNRLYCSPRCRQLAHDYELRYSHARRKGEVDLEERALVAYAKYDRDYLDMHVSAVASMCGACEPEGYCRTPECPLRTVSPLPLTRARLPITERRVSEATGRRWST